ncbi:unnamed protein product [Ectocarpus sp. 12 AP-2014]
MSASGVDSEQGAVANPRHCRVIGVDCTSIKAACFTASRVVAEQSAVAIPGHARIISVDCTSIFISGVGDERHVPAERNGRAVYKDSPAGRSVAICEGHIRELQKRTLIHVEQLCSPPSVCDRAWSSPSDV